MLDKIESWQARNPILAARIRKKMSRDGLAARLGVTYRTIRIWETGLSRPTINNMAGLCFVLGASLRAKYLRWRREHPTGRLDHVRN